MEEKIKKASQMFAVIRRSFHHLNKNFLTLYKSLVRTHPGYASSIWLSMIMKWVEQIEGVQRKDTQQIPGMEELSYDERLRELKLPALAIEG